MRVLALKTYTIDCDNKVRSLKCIGHDVNVMEYDDRPHDRQGEIVDYAKYYNPHAIVYIGAVEQYHGRPVLSPDILCRLKDVAPTIHLCGDAGDTGWWETLELYDRQDCFSVQVSMDGSRETPIAKYKNGLILLTPTDISPFKPLPWEQRIVGGTVSGQGSFGRSDTYNKLKEVPGFEWKITSNSFSYDEVGEFMSRCQVIANHSATGNGRHHVKGRVVEAGFAHACLLESRNMITSNWFRPSIEYLEYTTPEHAKELLEWMRDCPISAQQMGQNLARAVNSAHHPVVFWKKVFEKAGVKC